MSSLVSLAFFDLRRHVGHGAAVRLQSIDALVASESKVGNFQVKIFVYEDIFELQIAVDDSLLMHVVDRIKQLRDKEATGVLAHGTHRLTEVKKESSWYKLHHDVDQVLDAAPGRLEDFAGVAVAEKGHETTVVQVFEDSDLVVDGKDRVSVSSQELLLEDLDRCKCAVFNGATKVNFRCVTFAERLCDLVLSVENGMLLARARRCFCHSSDISVMLERVLAPCSVYNLGFVK